jgi:hypothetical protein
LEKNSDKYHFSDFTYTNYRKLILLAGKNYNFRNFSNYKKGERFIIWRHDVDCSVDGAVILAGIEKEMGICSSYSILLHSEFYNVLDKKTFSQIIQIYEMGHEIGLHFDPHFYNVQEKVALEKYLKLEKNFLDSIFPFPFDYFTFHKNNDFTLSIKEEYIAGMLNGTNWYFQENTGFCADSNGFWRFRRLQDVLEQAIDHSLQVITHPIWWQENTMSPKERLNCTIEKIADNIRSQFFNELKEGGRICPDWE